MVVFWHALLATEFFFPLSNVFYSYDRLFLLVSITYFVSILKLLRLDKNKVKCLKTERPVVVYEPVPIAADIYVI